MKNWVDTRVPAEVEAQVHAIYRDLCQGDKGFVPRAFGWLEQCFSGNYTDYQAIDARYHDFEHTLQGTLCLARLLQGWHRAGAKPPLTRHLFELGLLAILFHDTGYLKKNDDTEGTGAKYTAIHVARSADFAGDFLGRQGYTAPDITSIQNMIRCTGINVDLKSIPFTSEADRLIGFALATADLLGQMAADDYVDKLGVLYQEFAEALDADPEHTERLAVYTNPDEMLRRTPAFWAGYVLPRIKNEFRSLYLFLNEPYPDGPNVYLQAVEANMNRIRAMLTRKGLQPFAP